ncbi:MAG: radical SAM protein [Bacteroidales bacterium]
MKIGLVNPNRDIKNPAIHLGLGYIASYLMEHLQDVSIMILDTRVAGKKETKVFFNTHFDLVGITATSQVFLEAVEISNKIKDHFPSTLICIGGPHPSTVLEESLEGFPFDFAVYGEGEITFYELTLSLRGKMQPEDINGLIYRDISGKIRVNPPRSVISDINILPFPAYWLFKMKNYPQHRLVTSRGCPYDCVFCNSSAIWTRKWRMRNPESIIDEIEFLIKFFGKKTFTFNDDSFNINSKRVLTFCNQLINRKLEIIWSVPIRVDLVTEQTALLMKKAGCYSVSIGIESANNEVLKRMNKNNSIHQISEGINLLKKAAIEITGQFMIGNPGDTLDTIKESVEFAKKSDLSSVEFYTALPYKGSELWEFVKNNGKILTDLPAYYYHKIEPRIIFETPDFSFEDRKQAINLAIDAGFYNALSTDKKSILLDSGKKIAGIFQILFKGKFGNELYLKMRKIYKKWFTI